MTADYDSRMTDQNEDREFRVMPNVAQERMRDRRSRLFMWGGASLLVGITLFAVFESPFVSSRTNLTLAWIAGVTVTSSIAGAYVLAYQHGLRKLRRSLVLILNENGLVRRRPGWPDVRIGLTEIHRLRESRSWLVVESVEPHRRIYVPTDVRQYATLKEES